MECEVSKTEAAVEQLDWAIRLFLDHQAYRPALTLAGAAEDILGKAVGDCAALHRLKSTNPQTDLNKARNWLKHPTDPQEIRLDWLDAAVQMIGRALSNLTVHDADRLPPSFAEFWTWLREAGWVRGDLT